MDRGAWGLLISRKMVSATISSCVLVMLVAFLDANARQEEGAYVRDFAFGITFVIVYAWPAVFIYGTFSSIVSELISRRIVPRSVSRSSTLRLCISAALHLIFGIVLGTVSLLAAAIFFAVDTGLAAAGGRFGGLSVLKSLLLPIALFGSSGIVAMLAS
ncbi:hypothetical protein ACFFSY_20750 [Paenibacillus aurantiacus]|uniref:Uncharacterized protein n=1 Tax=Paenibacillus aurantiacus TaxID=1936118 RepID=A0ABV5KT18_9BACL